MFVLRQLMETLWEYDTPMYLARLHLENAFDRAPRKTKWNEIPTELKESNHDWVCTARNSKGRVGADERFYTRGSISGVEQGSILTPLLFIMNLVIREVATTQEDHNYILHTGSLTYSMLMISICLSLCHDLSMYWPIIALGTRECGVAKLCRDPTVQSEFFLRVSLRKTYCYR